MCDVKRVIIIGFSYNTEVDDLGGQIALLCHLLRRTRIKQ